MSVIDDSVTVTLPRSAVGGVLSLSKALLDRMHELLEQNTDGSLSSVQKEELEGLVEMSQFAQLFSTSLHAQFKP